MENELISNEVENKMIDDLKKIIDKKQAGKIMLKHYVDGNMGACMDFAMIYEASSDLQFFINEERRKGVKIEIGEDAIEIL